ncbi:MAG: D-sedoheptulose 7-phosphate isomerase [Pseudomonadota bacterium]
METTAQALIESELAGSRAAINAVYADEAYRSAIGEVAECYLDALQAGKKLLFAGNGGSAADAQHIAGELVSRFHFDRPGLAAISLSTDTSIMTSIGNDYGYDRLFARQIEALGQPGDVFTAITTSGNSENILQGIEAARAKGLKVVGMTGETGGKMATHCDLVLHAPSSSTPRIQECHLVTYHLLCAYVESALFGSLAEGR